MKKISIATKTNYDDIIKIQEVSNEILLSNNVIQTELEDQNFIYLIAFLDDRPIGYLAASFVLDTMDLLSILVIPEFRKNGIASALLEELLQFCNNKKINNILLEVRPSNIGAINLYNKFNFKQIDTRKNYYKNEDALIYKLEIK